MNLSFSQVTAYKACNLRWWFRYVGKIRPQEKRACLSVGTMGHALLHNAIIDDWGMEKGYEHVGWPLSEAEREQYSDDDYETLSQFHYESPEIIDAMVQELKDDGWDFLYLEETLYTNIGRHSADGYISFKGVVDAIARDKEGLFWIIDWKFRDKMTAHKEWNPQLAMYVKMAMDTLGINIDGVLIYEIKSKAPKAPNINKNGTISRSAVSTDWATYSMSVVNSGGRLEDYDDMRIKLQEKKFRQKHEDFWSLDAAEKVVDLSIMPFAENILDDVRSDIGYDEAINKYGVHYGFVCTACDYQKICSSIPYGVEERDLVHLGYNRSDKK